MIQPRCLVVTLQSDLTSAEAAEVWSRISTTKGVALLSGLIWPDTANFEAVKQLCQSNQQDETRH